MIQPFRLIAIVFLLTCITFGQQGEFRFTVLDEKGAAFPGLKPGDVRITVDKKVITPVELRLDSASLSLLITIDASMSQLKMLPFEKRAAAAFIDAALRPGMDRVGVASFANTPTLIHDLTKDFEKAKTSLDKIRIVPPTGYLGGGVIVRGPVPRGSTTNVGATSMYDALERLIGDLAYSGFSGERKAILLISDGYVTGGEKKLKDVVRASERARIPVYVIGIGDTTFEGVDEIILKKLAAETGGVATFPGKESKIAEILPKLVNPLRSSYVAMLPLEGGKGRKIEVEIVAPTIKRKLRVLAPGSF